MMGGWVRWRVCHKCYPSAFGFRGECPSGGVSFSPPTLSICRFDGVWDQCPHPAEVGLYTWNGWEGNRTRKEFTSSSHRAGCCWDSPSQLPCPLSLLTLDHKLGKMIAGSLFGCLDLYRFFFFAKSLAQQILICSPRTQQSIWNQT